MDVGRAESLPSHPEGAAALGCPHPFVVRITHWITAITVIGLVVSGTGILLAHPRLSWGETGALRSPSVLDLPLPFMIGGPSGWGRSLHFVSAWASIPTGIVYAIFSARTMRFGAGFAQYSRSQRITYRVVVLLLFPLMIWTGFAMSPALTAVWASLVTVLGGQQSARTIHFFAASALVVFAIAHVVMVSRRGIRARVGRMLW